MEFDQKKILDYLVNLNQIKEGYSWEDPKITHYIKIHYLYNIIEEQYFMKTPHAEALQS